MTVRVSAQVVDFVGRLAPVPRRQLRAALRELAKGKGDIKQLEGPLQNYCRLRVGRYRVILSYRTSRRVECVFAEHRNIVYEVFADTMIDRLLAPVP